MKKRVIYLSLIVFAVGLLAYIYYENSSRIIHVEANSFLVNLADKDYELKSKIVIDGIIQNKKEGILVGFVEYDGIKYNNCTMANGFSIVSWDENNQRIVYGNVHFNDDFSKGIIEFSASSNLFAGLDKRSEMQVICYPASNYKEAVDMMNDFNIK
jgi:hypothetical protein